MGIATAVAALVVGLAITAYAISDVGSESGSDEASSSAVLPQGSEPVDLNPADFTTRIDNPYWPMAPGSRWVYRETDTEGTKQRVVVTVTPRTKKMANGVEARVVHDVTQNGQLVEVTDDWYAQDSDGNVWYMGEDTAEYQNGKVTTTAGSFEAGVDGAQPGIIVPANPEVGLGYRQEYYAGQAEDKAEILSLDEQGEVPFGHFSDVMLTKDLNPLEPKYQEYKQYARGVGPIQAITVSGGTDREELLSYKPGRS
jgi:hypothetical protein